MNFSNIFYVSLIIPLCHLFLYQVKSLNIKQPESCLKIFKSNNIIGLIIYFNILLGKFF